MSDDDTAETATPGAASSPKLVKAGCGVRFDPDSLSADTGFDFEAAKQLLQQQQDDAANQAQSENEDEQAEKH